VCMPHTPSYHAMVYMYDIIQYIIVYRVRDMILHVHRRCYACAAYATVSYNCMYVMTYDVYLCVILRLRHIRERVMSHTSLYVHHIHILSGIASSCTSRRGIRRRRRRRRRASRRRRRAGCSTVRFLSLSIDGWMDGWMDG
jgi:hypothetical protein